MAKEHSHEPEMAGPLQEGEFRRISGIGPGIEKRLHAAGVKTFDRLASLSPEKIADLLGNMVGVKAEIITRKDWTGQARRFARQLPQAEENIAVEADEPAERQYYESYMVELLLDEEHAVRRTRITHVKDGNKDSWAGWEPGKIDSWIAARAGLRSPRMEQAAADALSSPSEEMVSAKSAPAFAMDGMADSSPKNHKAGLEKEEPLAQAESKRIQGSLEIRDISIIRLDENRPSHFSEAGKPLEVRLAMNLSQVQVPPQVSLEYKAIVIARRLGSPERSEQGQSQGSVLDRETVSVNVPVKGLAEGVYRMETLVMIYPAGDPLPERSGIQALSEGRIVQVLASEMEPGA
jgi:predicted flap endonuclease-1-like 5' DNA nuclease